MFYFCLNIYFTRFQSCGDIPDTAPLYIFKYSIGVGSFSILGGGGGGANPARPTSILGGGGYCQKYIFACVCMYMYAHTCVKYSYTHACMHVCMHAQPMQTYILHPDMKIIKIKASDLCEKQQQTRKVLVIYIA